MKTLKTTNKATQEHKTFLNTVLPHLDELTDTSRLWDIFLYVLMFPEMEALLSLANPASLKSNSGFGEDMAVHYAASVIEDTDREGILTKFADAVLKDDAEWVNEGNCPIAVLAWFNRAAFWLEADVFQGDQRDELLNLMRALVWPILRELKDPRYEAQS